MTHSPCRRTTRVLAVAAVGVVAVLALSGCLSMTANLSISSDAKTTGTFAIGLQKQAASMLGMKDLDTFTSGITNPDLSEGNGDLLAGDCTASETDTEFVYTCTLSGDEPASADTPWTVTKSGDVITFRMVSTATDDSADDLLQGGTLGQLTAQVTFPGTITSVTGDKVTKDSGTSVTIKAAMSDPVDVTVTSEASATSSPSRVILIVGVVLLAIIVIALIAFFVTRRKDDTGSAVVEAPPEPKPDLS